MILHFSGCVVVGARRCCQRRNMSNGFLITYHQNTSETKRHLFFSDLGWSQSTTAAAVSNACRIERKLPLRSRKVYRPIQHLSAIPGAFYYYSETQCIMRTSFISCASVQYAVRLAGLVGPLISGVILTHWRSRARRISGASCNKPEFFVISCSPETDSIYKAILNRDTPEEEIASSQRNFCKKCSSMLWLYDATWYAFANQPFSSLVFLNCMPIGRR